MRPPQIVAFGGQHTARFFDTPRYEHGLQRFMRSTSADAPDGALLGTVSPEPGSRVPPWIEERDGELQWRASGRVGR